MKVSQEELEDFELDYTEHEYQQDLNTEIDKIKGKSRPLNQ